MRRTILMAMGVWGVGACGDPSGGEGGGAVVTDSAGVSIVVSSASDGGVARWDVGEDLLRVGDETEPLFRILGAVRTTDGGVAVGTGDTHEIVWFGSDGTVLERAGGQGGGPTEYRWLAGIVRVPGDSILAGDFQSGRLDLYGPDRALARSFVTRPPEGGFPPPLPFARLDDGTFLRRTASTEDPYPGRQVYDAHLLRHADGRLVDTLASFPGAETFTVRCGPDDSAVCNIGVIYGPVSSGAARGSRIVVSGRGEQIRVYDDGVLRRILRLDEPPTPVGPSDVEAYVDSLVAAAEDAGFDASRVATVRRRQEGAPAAGVFPRFVDLEVDPAGRIWAARGDAAGGRWDVFSAEGVRIATIVLPPRSTVHEIGDDWVVLSSTDALGAEAVRVVPILR